MRMNYPLDSRAAETEMPLVIPVPARDYPDLALTVREAAEEITDCTGIVISHSDKKNLLDIARRQLLCWPDNRKRAMFESVRQFCIAYLGGLRNPASEARTYYRRRMKEIMARF